MFASVLHVLLSDSCFSIVYVSVSSLCFIVMFLCVVVPLFPCFVSRFCVLFRGCLCMLVFCFLCCVRGLVLEFVFSLISFRAVLALSMFLDVHWYVLGMFLVVVCVTAFCLIPFLVVS